MSDSKPMKHLDYCQRTVRGFEIIHFMDANEQECTLQQSSAIDETERGMRNPGSSCLWLGTKADRMHLGREHVSELVAIMQRWLETGSIDHTNPREPHDD